MSHRHNLLVIAFGLLIASTVRAANRSQVFNFDSFTPESYSRHARDSWGASLRTALEHPAGLPSLRLKTSIPPGQELAMLRTDVENIDSASRIRFITGLFTSIAPRNYLWDNLFLVWASFLPDSENGQVMRIRNLAIDLQDMDVDGTWGYALLRQKVHNFPSSQIVQELADEIKKIEASNKTDARLPVLRELHDLERDFWFGKALSGDYVLGWLKVFGIEDRLKDFTLQTSDSPLRIIEKLLEVRERTRRWIGFGSRSIEQLMDSDQPLSEQEAETLMSYLLFDRKLSVEITRQFSKLIISAEKKEAVCALARALFLEGFLVRKDRDLVIRLAEDLSKNFFSIQRILEFPILDIQGRFNAMKSHYQKIYDQIPPSFRNNQQLTPLAQDILGRPERLLNVADMEIRQSILFNVGIVTSEIARSFRQSLSLRIHGQDQRVSDFEMVRPINGPMIGRVVVVRDAESLARAQEYAASGKSVILVKLIEYDIDLPPISVLVTVDRALNRASHMALLAESSRIPHINVENRDSLLVRRLLEFDRKEILLAADGDRLEIGLAKDSDLNQVKSAKLSLTNRIDDSFDKPVRLENLIATEATLAAPKNQISGGKGRGLGLLLSLANEKEREILGVPAAIQIPYGFFMRWFSQIQILGDWNRATSTDTNDESVRWSRLHAELGKSALPAVFVDEIQAALEPDDLSSGWFIRSNSIGEDGQFNAAGVNLTIPDVRNAKDLSTSMVGVFLAPYRSKALSWWRRMFINPHDVRSTVLMMKSVRSTHSSVVVLSDRGDRFTIDSLPGTGENVVGGTGAIAERILIETESGKVFREHTLQSAFGHQLRVWRDGQLVLEPLLIKGAVLDDRQKENVCRLLTLVRTLADQTYELRGKPLDIELAWEKDRPRLVQVREAPRNPIVETGALHLNGATPPHSGPVARLDPQLLIQSIVSELKKDSTITADLGVKFSLLRSMGGLDGQGRDILRAALIESREHTFQSLLDASLHFRTGINQLQNAQINLNLLTEDNREARRFYRFPSDKAELIVKTLSRLLPILDRDQGARLLTFSLYGFSETDQTRLLLHLIEQASEETVIKSYLPLYNRDRAFRDGFQNAVSRHLVALLTSVGRDQESIARASYIRLTKLWPAFNGQGDLSCVNSVYQELQRLIVGRFGSATLEAEYRFQLREFLEPQKVTLERDRNDGMSAEIAHLFKSFESIRSLTRMKYEFLEDVLELEERKKPEARSLDSILGVYLETFKRVYQGQGRHLERAFQLLTSLPEFKITVLTNKHLEPEVSVCSQRQSCQYFSSALFPIAAIVRFPNIEFNTKDHTLRSDNNYEAAGVFASPRGDFPNASSLAADPDKILLQFLYTFKIARRSEVEVDQVNEAKTFLNDVLAAIPAELRVSTPQWYRWVQFYLYYAHSYSDGEEYGRNIQFDIHHEVFDRLAHLIEKHAPFRFSEWETVSTSVDVGDRGRMRQVVSFHPPAGKFSEALNFEITVRKISADSNRDVQVSFLNRHLTMRHEYTIAQLDPKTTSSVSTYLKALNWISGGRFAKMMGAADEAGSNRLRRLQQCQIQLETLNGTQAPVVRSH